MAVDTSPDFVVAIAYCLAYDHLRRAPNRDSLQRLRGGAEPRTDEEHLFSNLLRLPSKLKSISVTCSISRSKQSI
jgi:hypothetical protein